VFTCGALDQAVSLLRQHPEAGRVVSLVPALPTNYWRTVPSQGAGPTGAGEQAAGQPASLRPAWSEDGGTGVSGRTGVSGGTAVSGEGENGAVYLETGHFEVIRLTGAAGPPAAPPAGGVTLPLILDPVCGVSVKSPLGWEWLDWAIQYAGGSLHQMKSEQEVRGEQDLRQGEQDPLRVRRAGSGIDLVYPGRQPRPLPAIVALLVMDFDGVLTDNRVWVDEEGHEQIAANRSDSLGLYYLRQSGIGAMVISMETNPVVTARCRKMKVPVLQGINDKATILAQYLADHAIDPGQVVYLGNDVNDLPCFPLVGCAVAVADSQPAVLRQADLVLTCRGGHAAVRELCDLLIGRERNRTCCGSEQEFRRD
jgi:YrbI family 3-deoxy-D-manno-octulosonate 8-phosphate phosphatase